MSHSRDAKTVLGYVERGLTLDGKRFAGLGPLPPIREPVTRADLVMFVSAALTDLDAIVGELELTLFLRTLVAHVRRYGVKPSVPAFLDKLTFATNAVLNTPAVASSPLPFVGLARLGKPTPRERQLLAPDEEVARMQRKVLVPPAEAIWSDTDGCTLHQLTAPFHVWEEGVRTKTALCRLSMDKWSSRVSWADPPSSLQRIFLAQPRFTWFSLRDRETRVALFMLMNRWLQSFILCARKHLRLWELIADAVTQLEDGGDMEGHNLRQHGDAARFVRQVDIQRARRGIASMECKT
ncbi:MAG: hypothetical protein JSR99_03520 [Proteobacteria bacterium]|nr:hypothetical protein [Pseudomonadota bacterium]